MTLRRDLHDIVGERGLIGADEDSSRFLQEWRDRATGQALAIVRPASTAEVVSIVNYARDNDLAIVTQGGNTGLCGGAIPNDSRRELLVVLDRLRRIEELDADGYSVLVQAGVTLGGLHEAATQANRRFGVSIAADGSATVGGAVSTNAGGIQVLRYGTMRAQVLGLEAVLADGTIWSDLRDLRKSTDGYSIRDWFVGAEGTLGIVTRARLKLWDLPQGRETLLLGYDDMASAVASLPILRSAFGDWLSAVELLSDRALRFVHRHMISTAIPITPLPSYALLVEVEGPSPDLVESTVEGALEAVLDGGALEQSIVAGSDAAREELWQIRHAVSEAQKPEGPSVKFDIALPISSLPAFDVAASALISRHYPGARPVIFGHVGDGNLHYNVTMPPAGEAQFAGQRDTLEDAIYELVEQFNGTISAEHGIGTFKRAAFEKFVPAQDRELMQSLKTALDPKSMLNPGKLLVGP